MKKYLLLILIACFISCDKDPFNPMDDPMDDPEVIIPPDAIEIFDFETKTTYLSNLSIYAANKDSYDSFSSNLNNEEVDLFSSITLEEAGYYELEIDAIKDSDTLKLNFQFVIVDSERGEAEWGLNKFSPKEIENKTFDLDDLTYIYPTTYPSDLSLPIIFNAGTFKPGWKNYYGQLIIDGNASTIKRGIGSITLGTERSGANINVNMNGAMFNLPIADTDPNYEVLSGSIENDLKLEEGGLFHITSDLIVEESVTLEITKGCILKIDEGINIINEGKILILGSETEPVVFACSKSYSQWGGFISVGDGRDIEADHAIFMQSGFHDSPEYQYGHAKRQALFLHEKSNLTLRNSYAIDNIGQIFYLHNKSELTIENTLIQRAISAGEVAGSDLEISESTFTDFPEYSTEYIDMDNDCLYLTQTDANISRSSFMWSKDDGIDTGGGKGGQVNISDCHFEGIFHEAIAMSSEGNATKQHVISNSTFKNNGQGIEMGYSTLKHNAIVHQCHFEENLIGIRYGDNYDRPVDGSVEITDCTYKDNIYQDIWNFVRSEWSAKDGKLIFL